MVEPNQKAPERAEKTNRTLPQHSHLSSVFPRSAKHPSGISSQEASQTSSRSSSSFAFASPASAFASICDCEELSFEALLTSSSRTCARPSPLISNFRLTLLSVSGEHSANLSLPSVSSWSCGISGLPHSDATLGGKSRSLTCCSFAFFPCVASGLAELEDDAAGITDSSISAARRGAASLGRGATKISVSEWTRTAELSLVFGSVASAPCESAQ